MNEIQVYGKFSKSSGFYYRTLQCISDFQELPTFDFMPTVYKWLVFTLTGYQQTCTQETCTQDLSVIKQFTKGFRDICLHLEEVTSSPPSFNSQKCLRFFLKVQKESEIFVGHQIKIYNWSLLFQNNVQQEILQQLLKHLFQQKFVNPLKWIILSTINTAGPSVT